MNKNMRFIQDNGNRMIVVEVEGADFKEVKNTIENSIGNFDELLNENPDVNSHLIGVDFQEIHSFHDFSFSENDYTVHFADVIKSNNCLFIEVDPYSNEIESIKSFDQLENSYLINDELRFHYETTIEEREQCELRSGILPIEKSINQMNEDNLIVIKGIESHDLENLSVGKLNHDLSFKKKGEIER